jgi:extracellular factor (EF) 3-hydroxypalmitic acid methyl ester biosynthesis protein
MHNERFFDHVLHLIDSDQVQAGLPMLAGGLHMAHQLGDGWPETKAILREHPLFETLQKDPLNAHSVSRPRGYPGDAGLIDMFYDRQPTQPPKTALGGKLFDISIAFSTAEAVRLRRAHAQIVVAAALEQGQRVCVLACGHFREADAFKGQDLSRFTLVDQDPLSLDVVRAGHGATATIVEANVFRYLRNAVRQGAQFDLIYTLGLTDYLDDRAMALLHRLMKDVMAPGGSILLANFLTAHFSAGWMEAVMDWPLIYRDEVDLADFARAVDLVPQTWRDQTNSVVWCRMAQAATT